MDKKKKKPTIDEMIDAGEQIGEGVKKVTPDKFDTAIDRGVQIAKAGNYVRKMFGGIFSRRSRLF
jgi:hypothetical protein